MHFHSTPGDRLRNVSRGAALEFETTFRRPGTITRHIFTTTGSSRINIWSRAYEVVHAELRREIRQVIQDYRRVKDRMVHRFVNEDRTGYTWTNDRDDVQVIWLLKDASLPDGRRGEAGKVYVTASDHPRGRTPEQITVKAFKVSND